MRDISFCYLVFLEHRYFAITDRRVKGNWKTVSISKTQIAIRSFVGTSANAWPAILRPVRAVSHSAMEQETRCHEPSAFYSNVEYSNDPRDGIIGSNDREWNPLATPSTSGQCVCLHPKEFIYGTIDGLIRRGKAQSMSL